MEAEWNAGEVGDGCSVTITDAVFGSKEFGVQEACDILTDEILIRDTHIAVLEVAQDELRAARDTAFADGAQAMVKLAHDAMEQRIGRALKVQQTAKTLRTQREMRAVADWIAVLQEEMFINPETCLRVSLPKQPE